jgi:hypothetical protein
MRKLPQSTKSTKPVDFFNNLPQHLVFGHLWPFLETASDLAALLRVRKDMHRYLLGPNSKDVLLRLPHVRFAAWLHFRRTPRLAAPLRTILVNKVQSDIKYFKNEWPLKNNSNSQIRIHRQVQLPDNLTIEISLQSLFARDHEDVSKLSPMVLVTFRIPACIAVRVQAVIPTQVSGQPRKRICQAGWLSILRAMGFASSQELRILEYLLVHCATKTGVSDLVTLTTQHVSFNLALRQPASTIGHHTLTTHYHAVRHYFALWCALFGLCKVNPRGTVQLSVADIEVNTFYADSFARTWELIRR